MQALGLQLNNFLLFLKRITPSARQALKIEKNIVLGSIICLLLAFLVNKIFTITLNGIKPIIAYGVLVVTVHLLVFSISLTKYRDLAKAGKNLHQFKEEELPLVSCMVAVHNEQDFVTECLDSIYGQTYEHIEVIVVNDCSTDSTRRVLRAYKKKHKDLKVINLKQNVGKKAALTEAMLTAKGTIFAHTDSDSVWDKDAIKRIVRIFMNNEDVGAISGHGRAKNGGENLITKVQDSWMEGQFSIRKAFESAYGAVTCVSGPLAAYRKEAVYNVLGAWRDDRFLGSEFRFATDRTLTAMVLGSTWIRGKILKKYAKTKFTRNIYEQRDWKVVYSRSARSQTIVPNTLKKFLKQQVRWKKSFVRNTFFNVPFFWRKPLPVAFIFYVHILFVVCAPLVASRIFLDFQRDRYFPVVITYLVSVGIIGVMFALALRYQDKKTPYWYYRPLMSIFSATVLSWIIIYSVLTIKKMTWSRD
ncbi:MAG: hypothetical protein JWM00_185 [Candidatus Saccharibacteria bacterium]|nr:hypothetical protein [Candidatus Saccharibacteria bacterium]